MNIEYTNLGHTDIKITKITFGAWVIGGWNWGGSEETEAENTVRAAFESGMTTIDTAPIYGFGRSEEIIGKALREIPRDQYQLMTKFGLRWWGTEGSLHARTTDLNGNPVSIYRYAGRDSVIRECEQSLQRLQTDYLDLFQIHWPDPTTPIEETMEALQILLDQGKIRAAGVCNYDPGDIREALKHIRLASNQVPYSMIRRKIEKEIQPQAIRKGLSILPYSPLQRGLLTGKIKQDSRFREGDNRADSAYFTAENIEKVHVLLDKIRPIADQYEVSLAQLVLNWTSRQEGITSVLAGARSPSQARDNAHALSFRLSKDEMKVIQKAIDEYDGVKDE